MLQSELDNIRCLAARVFSSSCSGGSFLDTLLLGSRSLRTVLVEKSEHRHGLILGKCLCELVDSRGNLKTLVENRTLTLEAHISGPLDEPTQITALGPNVTTNVKGTGARGVERVRRLGDRLDFLLFLAFGSLTAETIVLVKLRLSS